MAIYAVGARYGSRDISKIFIKSGIAGIGWTYCNLPRKQLRLLMEVQVFGDGDFPAQAALGNGKRVDAVQKDCCRADFTDHSFKRRYRKKL